MSLRCPGCNATLTGFDSTSPRPRECPLCGAALPGDPDPDSATLPVDLSTRSHKGLTDIARRVGDTLFQPALLDTGDGEPEAAEPEAAEPEGREPVADDETRIAAAAVAPELVAEDRPYFLVVGASPGAERLYIPTARATFGRARADVLLADDSVSAPHFQVEVMGSEYFLRDLGSRNGTHLNGHTLRYSEILPGDEVRVGQTILVFRTPGDGISPRRG